MKITVSQVYPRPVIANFQENWDHDSKAFWETVIYNVITSFNINLNVVTLKTEQII